ncbi:MAG: DUF4956 domain-containing protein [Akkermansiaceae bacterium]|jgi:hypothetical protein
MKVIGQQILLALLFCLSGFAQEDPPDEVLEAFRKMYPNITNPEWEIDSNGSWEASFKIDDVKYRADFTPQGIWNETENKVDFNNLPANVREAFLLKYQNDAFREAEAINSSARGIFYEIEVFTGTSKIKVLFDEQGNILDPENPVMEKGFLQYWMDQAAEDTPLVRQGWSLIYKIVFNLITILLFAYVIYYRRHHDHKMLFLLLAFNLFLFPIFLSSSLVTAGFGFTIFALLALVRLRSEAFDKTEIAYLLGAISLTFVNTMMPVVADVFSAMTILATAFLVDRPSIWRGSFQKIEVDYKISEKELMLDQNYLRKKLTEEFQVDVREMTINKVIKNEVKLTIMYRDDPKLRKPVPPATEEDQPEEEPPY